MGGAPGSLLDLYAAAHRHGSRQANRKKRQRQRLWNLLRQIIGAIRGRDFGIGIGKILRINRRKTVRAVGRSHKLDIQAAGFVIARTAIAGTAIAGIVFAGIVFVRVVFVRAIFVRVAFVRIAFVSIGFVSVGFVRIAFVRIAVARVIRDELVQRVAASEWATWDAAVSTREPVMGSVGAITLSALSASSAISVRSVRGMTGAPG